MKKLILFLCLLLIPINANAVTRMWGRTAYIGGTSAVDGITGYADNDLCVVITSSNELSFHRYESSDVSAEASPYIIEPDDLGAGAWQLVGPYSAGAGTFKMGYDAAAFISIVTADGGATTISQTSDGTDQIIIGDGSDRVDISSNSWDVTNGTASGFISLSATSIYSAAHDAVGAVPMSYGSADITKHTFIADGGADSITIGSGTLDVDYGITFDSDTNDLTIVFDEDNEELEFTDSGGEALVIDLDTGTANEVGIGTTNPSSLTQISFGSLDLISTGSILGAVDVVSDGDGRAIAASEAYGTLHVATGTGTWTLPDVCDSATGANICLLSTTAVNVILDLDAGDNFVYEGTAESAGEALDSDDNAGEFICVVCMATNTWYVLGHTDGWTGE